MTYSKERFNALSAPQGGVLTAVVAWCVKQFYTIARTMPWAPHADTRDFITVSEGADCTAQFGGALTAVGAGTLFAAPRTYRFASDITFPAGALVDIANGALLRPASGKKITVKGVIRAGAWPVFDFTDGGTVDLSHAQINTSQARWYGFHGDGTTDDSAHFNTMVATLPSHHTVEFDQNLRIAASSTLAFNHKTQVKLTTATVIPHDANSGDSLPSFIWTGAPGGTLMTMQDAGNCEISGFFFDALTAGVGLDIDQSVPNDPSRICTENRVRRNKILGGAGNKNIVLLRLAAQSPSNVEYCQVEDNYFESASGTKVRIYNGGPFAINGSCTVTCTSGSTAITFGSAVLQEFITKGYTTVRWRVNGLGTAGRGTLLDTTLTILTATTATAALAPNANMAAATPYFMLDYNDGIGLQISHQNAKRQALHHNHYNTLNIGIDCEGGSFHADDENFPECECNIYIPNSSTISEPCWDRASNSEQSRMHLYVTSVLPYACEHPRLAPYYQPGSGAITVGPGCTGAVTLLNIECDNNPTRSSTGSTLFDLRGSQVAIISPTVPSDLTTADTGCDSADIAINQLVTIINAGQSGRVAFPMPNQTIIHYSPATGQHDVIYSLERSGKIFFLPDLHADAADLPLLRSLLKTYTGAMWMDYSGASSVLTIEEQDQSGTDSQRFIYNTLRGSATYDPPSLSALASTSTTITVTGAAMGNKCRAAFSLDLQSIILFPFVSSANTVTVALFNPTGSAVNLASGTLSVTVEKS